MDGVVRAPSLLSITFTLSPSMMATQELVVPRSIPIIFAIFSLLSRRMAALSALPPAECLRCSICGCAPAFQGGKTVILQPAHNLFSHHHPRRTQQAPIEGIALLQHVHHRV